MIPELRISHEKWGFNGSNYTYPAVLLMGKLCLIWAVSCESSVGNGIIWGCKLLKSVMRLSRDLHPGTRAAPQGPQSPV